jgi:hypothetical protein
MNISWSKNIAGAAPSNPRTKTVSCACITEQVLAGTQMVDFAGSGFAPQPAAICVD